MPAWADLLNQFSAQADDAARAAWLTNSQTQALQDISKLRGGKNVLLYASAFLQKPQAPAPTIQISPEDLNGLMSSLYGMQWEKGLCLILHTAGGVTNAAESIVAYLRSKFTDLEVVVPAFAMSAGTMISLAGDRIVMGRQSQLGPIDPQFFIGPGRSLSARAVVDQFERAKDEIKSDVTMAHTWAPVLATIGPALLQEAQNALDYGEQMVARWLEQYMFKGLADAATRAKATAKHFNDASTHKSHGRRIDRDEARKQGVIVEDLEADQRLQEAVLTSYHIMTIAVETTPAVKLMQNNSGRVWLKNLNMAAMPGRP
jgi:membrane-bound ClpP family serine protease